MNQLYIPLQNVTVTTTPTLQNIGIDSQCNITVKNSTGDNLIISTTDSMAQLKSFTVYAGNSTIIKKTNAYQVSFKAETSSTIFSAVSSWPDEVDPSSLTVAGTINTDIGQRTNTLIGTNPIQGSQFPPALDSNNAFIIRQLTSTDTPGKSWTLGTSDNPDVTVNQSKTTNIRSLTSTDTPGKSWLLGTSDNPVLSHGPSANIASTTVGGAIGTVPASTKWQIFAAYIYAESNGASPLQASISIARGNNTIIPQEGYELIANVNLSTAPASGTYVFGVGGVATSNALTYGHNVTVQQWSNTITVFPGDVIYGNGGNLLSVKFLVFYTSSNE